VELICERCGAGGPSKTTRKGYGLISWVLFYLLTADIVLQFLGPPETPAQVSDANSILGVLFVAWLAHLAFRMVTTRKVCPSCEKPKTMIPLESPQGQKLAQELKATPPKTESKGDERPRKWRRVLGIMAPLAAIIGAGVWTSVFDPPPTQDCFKFYNRAVEAQLSPDTKADPVVKDVVLLRNQAAQDKFIEDCRQAAIQLRHARGRVVYLDFLKCIRGASTAQGLQSCVSGVQPQVAAEHE
jgi:hypothetical protein